MGEEGRITQPSYHLHTRDNLVSFSFLLTAIVCLTECPARKDTGNYVTRKMNSFRIINRVGGDEISYSFKSLDT